ncbi:methyltransferase domain-containing protein [Collimonas sp.]|jgi:SAM-dependent methyltransferase|uniref:methyltransferase domain-containing protein n=1 Tax=Collimonas sp. TaxID=1963772 RepID=UPI002BD55DE4|nr:methyltransferase domain-containing protein [Collimonas sp.]HWW05716.1 methyltransferase domain-containing protein [Collimonas sp.]
MAKSDSKSASKPDPNPKFSHRDPSHPDFWSERFEQDFTPWDTGGVPQALQQYVARAKPAATLIPGCGSGYEVAFLAEAGWDVTAIDFSSAAVDAARKVLGKWSERVLQADFFTYQPQQPLGLIYERAFLCALPPARRAAIVSRWAELLPAAGTLAGFFYFDDAPKGPPFGISRVELERLLHTDFELANEQDVTDSITVFAGKERWMEWRRRG